jgi:hypothetical protein
VCACPEVGAYFQDVANRIENNDIAVKTSSNPKRIEYHRKPSASYRRLSHMMGVHRDEETTNKLKLSHSRPTYGIL